MKILLGIDNGTGGCKVTAIDETGAFVGEASTEYATYHDRPGWSEQEPGDWWTALCTSLKKLSEKGVDLKSVAALALDGSTHNAVLLDGGYNPIRRTIMWTDQRATAECEELRAKWGEKIFATCFQMPAPTWTLPQMMWLKAHEPEALERVEHVLFVKDYVRYLMTGHAATDYIEAQGTLLCNIKWLNCSIKIGSESFRSGRRAALGATFASNDAPSKIERRARSGVLVRSVRDFEAGPSRPRRDTFCSTQTERTR